MSQDPYDWPFPSRNQCMYLSTIKPVEPHQSVQLNQQCRDTCLNITDIVGSKPDLKPYRYTNKETFCNRNEDIAGTKSKQLIRTFNRPDLQLYNQDIKGTQPQIAKFVTNRQSGNPLEPVYHIPSYLPAETIVPKFVRDSYNVHDIEGAKPSMVQDKLKKTPIIYDEVDGSHPKVRFYAKDHGDSLNVKDINEYFQHKSNRVTNPLEPVYIVRDENGNKSSVGEVDGSKSKTLHPKEINKMASAILTTVDIKGAQAGTHSQQFLRSNERKDFRLSNDVQDIDGVKAGSLRKGISTIRQTNPLMPAYQIPGHMEIQYNEYLISNPQSVFSKNASTSLFGKSDAQKMDKFRH